MRPTLQLRIGQQLTMTPQLQQAIKLLQLSTLDLQQEIQEALESNPLLEVDELVVPDSEAKPDNLEEAFSAPSNDDTLAKSKDGSEDSTPTIDEISTAEAMDKKEIPEENEKKEQEKVVKAMKQVQKSSTNRVGSLVTAP